MSLRFLFICTHNRCRSILAEAITQQLAGGRIIAASAGSQPAGEVHPLSLKFLEERGFSTDGLKSKSWNEFKHFKANAIISLCDQAATEPCPIWFGNEVRSHWGLADPSTATGGQQQIRNAFNNTIDTIVNRVESLLKLNLEQFSDIELARQIQKLSNQV